MNIRWEDVGSEWVYGRYNLLQCPRKKWVTESYIDMRLVRPTLAYTY